MPATVINVEENTLSLPSEQTGIQSHTNTHTQVHVCTPPVVSTSHYSTIVCGLLSAVSVPMPSKVQ